MHVTYLIIGAGPTGLGAARRLQELGADDFLLLEANSYVGGLAASFTDPAGFTWDLGGHVVFSHYDYYGKLLDEALGDQYLEHHRIAAIRMAGQWIPYPFQNNLRYLPSEMQWECVRGLLQAAKAEVPPPANFGQWIEQVFGAGVARLFMNPYNFKVWATPLERMGYSWIGERVSVVDLEGVLQNLILDRDDVSWGPNRTFRFPLRGGTGAIYTAMARPLQDRIRLNVRTVAIDPASKTVRTDDGQDITYDHLLSTGPLDKLVLELIGGSSGERRQAAGNLAHNGVFIAGVGVAGQRDDPTCWMYFPEDNCPFYRCTNFHNYSPNNAPEQVRALMAETSYSAHKPENLDTLLHETIQGLVNVGLATEEEVREPRTAWSATVEYGYPVPSLEREPSLNLLQPWLESHSIYSRGRFGGWRYEVSNMDHSVMQGVEWADRMVQGADETTYKNTWRT